MKALKCYRCNHVWFKRSEKNPLCCPRCKSFLWNKKKKTEEVTE